MCRTIFFFFFILAVSVAPPIICPSAPATCSPCPASTLDFEFQTRRKKEKGGKKRRETVDPTARFHYSVLCTVYGVRDTAKVRGWCPKRSTLRLQTPDLARGLDGVLTGLTGLTGPGSYRIRRTLLRTQYLLTVTPPPSPRYRSCLPNRSRLVLLPVGSCRWSQFPLSAPQITALHSTALHSTAHCRWNICDEPSDETNCTN